MCAKKLISMAVTLCVLVLTQCKKDELAVTTTTSPFYDIIVTETDGITAVNEPPITTGNTDTYSIHLSDAPSTAVTITIGDPLGKLTIVPSQIKFSASNYNAPQTITVTANYDSALLAPVHYVNIKHLVVAGDNVYRQIVIPDVVVAVTEAQVPNVIVLDPGVSLALRLGGTAAYHYVRLTSKPSAPVTIVFQSKNGYVAFNPPSLTFDVNNWDLLSSVIVTINASVAPLQGVLPDEIRHAVSSSDPYYGALGTSAVMTKSVSVNTVP